MCVCVHTHSLKVSKPKLFTEEFMCKGCSLVLEMVNYYAGISFVYHTEWLLLRCLCHHYVLLVWFFPSSQSQPSCSLPLTWPQFFLVFSVSSSSIVSLSPNQGLPCSKCGLWYHLPKVLPALNFQRVWLKQHSIPNNVTVYKWLSFFQTCSSF